MRTLLLLVAVGTALAQSIVSGVNLQLSLADGKIIYRSGEPIRVILSFTAEAPGYKSQHHNHPSGVADRRRYDLTLFWRLSLVG